jgi:hypothetical protein
MSDVERYKIVTNRYGETTLVSYDAKVRRGDIVEPYDLVCYEDYSALQQENEKLKSRLASIDAILKVCFSPIPKITQHNKNRNG